MINSILFLFIYLFYIFTYIYIYFTYFTSILKEMNHYQDILSDLNANSSQEIIEYPPPYETNMSIEEKFKQTRKALSRAKSMNNRILTLVNAYYLGQLLEI